ncbi:hypothetical protein JN01_0636 [Entomoplasma freundtii]|uniref:Uncharacterized protein n=1 Tax=Entomoplasma freundtii TaxID=74700 RepID=A0A2K8NRB7_9MOLU|nr:hypothetical protein [Entomoplasma freundtii]ATZ16324.1 hypothetical protein EFREU_v1c02980 [Entomoplasma freundtii]TDY56637.1 hypothetical protein JN01_0636 [Entomoplasma freundtii]
MTSFKKILEPRSQHDSLLAFFKEANQRLIYQFVFWTITFFVSLVATLFLTFLTNNDQTWELVLFLFFFILTIFSFLSMLWKGSLLHWSFEAKRIFGTRYRTSLHEDKHLLKSYEWILRSFLSYRIVDGALTETKEMLEAVDKKILIDYKRINTPKVDVWLYRCLNFLWQVILAILSAIPKAITWWNYRFGWGRSRATKKMKMGFRKMHKEFLHDLDKRTIW